MSRFPSYTDRQVIKKLRKLGLIRDRQVGSHEIWKHTETKKTAVVPRHAGQTIKRKTLKSICASVGKTIEEFKDI